VSTRNAEEDSKRTIHAVRERMDSNSGAPKYHVLAEALRQAIDEEVIPRHSFLGNELDIAAGLGVSRPTLRRSMAVLADRGLIVRRRGSGSVVLGSPVRRNVALTSLYEDLAATDGKPSSRVLAFETVQPDAGMVELFSLRPGQALTYVRRLRFSSSAPLAIMENYLPGAVGSISKEELETSSLYRILETRGMGVQVASQTIGARNATPAEANLLELEMPASVLEIERHGFSQSGRAVELARHAYNAELYSVAINLVRG